MRNETGLVCDFCGKTEAEVEVLVVSVANAAICDECVELSLEVIAEYREHKEFWSKCHKLARDESTAGEHKDKHPSRDDSVGVIGLPSVP